MPRREAVCFGFPPLITVQRLSSVRGGKGDVWFTCCIKGWEPKIYELWTFADEGIREVCAFARDQISDDFIGETFHTNFFNAKAVRIPLLGRRPVNGSVQ